MGRKKKYPNYDAQRIFNEYLLEVAAAYQRTNAERQRQPSLRTVADEFDTSILKIRKLLITAKVFRTEISDKVNHLYQEGKTIEEIMQELHLSKSSVHSYLPYVKMIYNAKESSANANRLYVYRRRKEAIRQFRASLERKALSEKIIWDTLITFAGYSFYTSQRKKFSYYIKGYEMYVDRKTKAITKSTVFLFVNRVLALQSAGEKIVGPKIVGTFGASYLFSIFKKIGLLDFTG